MGVEVEAEAELANTYKCEQGKIRTKGEAVHLAALHLVHLKDNCYYDLKSSLLIGDKFWTLPSTKDYLNRKLTNFVFRHFVSEVVAIIKDEDVIPAGHPVVLISYDLQRGFLNFSDGFAVVIICGIVEFIIKLKMLIDEDSK